MEALRLGPQMRGSRLRVLTIRQLTELRWISLPCSSKFARDASSLVRVAVLPFFHSRLSKLSWVGQAEMN